MTTRSLHFPAPLDCAAVQVALADWLDAPAGDPAVERHLAGCAECAALADDLRAVTRAAAALPPLAPPAHLWDGIAARLGAQAAPAHEAPAPAGRVLDFTVHRTTTPLPASSRRAPSPAWRLAAAAVVLVAATAGVTYQLARRAPNGPSAVAVAPNAEPSAAPARPADGAPPTPQPVDVADAADDGRDTVAPAPTGPAPRRLTTAAGRAFVRRQAAAPIVAVARPADVDAAVPGAAAYDREIAALRAAVRERRGELDSATVAVLVRNLRVIDAAIAQSRAALARDPHSPFLGDRLTRALGRKVDLLRTAALLPST